VCLRKTRDILNQYTGTQANNNPEQMFIRKQKMSSFHP
jgi:hypothetical protein